MNSIPVPQFTSSTTSSTATSPIGSPTQPKQSLLQHQRECRQVHENDPAQIVILNDPDLCQWMGSIHPNGSLYEKPLDISRAKKEHLKFRKLLESQGCKVYTVKEILLGSFKGTNVDIKHRVKLEDFAFNSVTYLLDASQSETELGEDDRKLLSEDYKRECLATMSTDQLVDVILTRPTIRLCKSMRDTELLATEYSFKPLVNLVFQRDQQITTAKGIVMANLSSPIREPEVKLMRLCFELLGLDVIGSVPSPGKLEGGDFYPCGEDLCFIGVGLRSNFEAVQYLMDNHLLGTTKVAVVKDYFDQNQQRMHLDTVCNIVDQKVMLILEDICGDNPDMKPNMIRLVDEYTLNPKTNKYELSLHDVEFSRYLTVNQGFHLVKATNQNQIDYGCNGLNIGNGRFIVVDQNTGKTIARSSKTNTELLYVNFSTVTKMYGSVHCCSQVISRKTSGNPLIGDVNSQLSTESPKSILAQQHRGKDQILMVAPTYFVHLKDGGIVPNAAHIRNTRQKVLHDYSKLFKILNDLDVNVHLFAHEPHHQTDRALFVREWFSTHSAEEVGVSTLVLYPLANKDKRAERRDDILRHAFGKYQRVLDFTPYEHGIQKVNTTTVEEYLATRSHQPNGASDNGTYLDFDGIVLDRKNKIAFISIDEKRNYSNVAKAWAKELGYQLIEMKSNYQADRFLALGIDFAIFCPEALEESSTEVQNQIEKTGRKILTITKEQMINNIAQFIQVFTKSETDKPIIIISKSNYNTFDETQKEFLKSETKQIIQTDLSNLEEQGGKSLIDMIGHLY